jgi:hypothetical protein
VLTCLIFLVFIYFHVLSLFCLFKRVFTGLFACVGNCWFVVLSIRGRQELLKKIMEPFTAEE